MNNLNLTQTEKNTPKSGLKKQPKMIIVIEGPSGVGKDTTIQALINRYPDRFAKLTSVATRAMRPGESQGHPYHFVDNATFDQMVQSGDVFEFTIRHGEKRGMSEKYIHAIFDQNKIPLKDCDLVGVKALRSRFDHVLTIFLTADKDMIAHRLQKRGDDPAEIAKRLADYDNYMTNAQYYDNVVDSTDLDKSIDKILQIIDNYSYIKGEKNGKKSITK